MENLLKIKQKLLSFFILLSLYFLLIIFLLLYKKKLNCNKKKQKIKTLLNKSVYDFLKKS